MVWSTFEQGSFAQEECSRGSLEEIKGKEDLFVSRAKALDTLWKLVDCRKNRLCEKFTKQNTATEIEQ